MIVLVLLHKGRGGGLSDMFGGGVSSSLGGSSVAERNLDRITVGIGVIWFACVIALGPAAGLLRRNRPIPRRSTRRGRWRKRDPGQPGRRRARWARRSAARPRPARRSPTSAPTTTARSSRSRSRPPCPDSWDCPQVRPPGQPRLREPAAGSEDRALQDPPGLREGASLRRRGGRGILDEALETAALPPQGRRHHLLTLPASPRRRPVRRRPRRPRRGTRSSRTRPGRRGRGSPRPGRRASAAATASALPSPLTRNQTASARLQRREGQGTRSGGGLGESWTATAIRSSTARAGWPGKSEATWPSGPRPSMRTSNEPAPCSRSASA